MWDVDHEIKGETMGDVLVRLGISPSFDRTLDEILKHLYLI